MDGFIFSCAQQDSAGRGWAAVDGGSVEGPEVSVLGWGGLGVLSRSGSPIAVVNRGWGWFGKGLWGRGSQHRQGDQCYCWGERGQRGLVGPVGPLGTMGHWGQQLLASLGTAGALFWSGEGENPAWAGQGVRAAVQGLAEV